VEHEEHQGDTKYTTLFCVADSSLPLRIARPKSFVAIVLLSVFVLQKPSGKLSTQVSTRYISFAF